jgi:hypothetical protein
MALTSAHHRTKAPQRQNRMQNEPIHNLVIRRTCSTLSQILQSILWQSEWQPFHLLSSAEQHRLRGDHRDSAHRGVLE